MKICFETEIAGWRIVLMQHKDLSFTVLYGKQEWENLAYPFASQKLGEAMMHALACEGKLDPR